MQTAIAGAACSSVGPSHTANEDSCLAGTTVFAVADGMGGHVGGATASRLAVEALRFDDATPTDPQGIRHAIQTANASILAAAASDFSLEGMGTTLAGLALVHDEEGERWLAFNIGDSRIYRLVAGSLVQVSTDHSLVQELIDANELTPERAASDPRRNVITRALGTEQAPAADFWVLTPSEGERYLLCSDGLSGSLPPPAIQSILAQYHDRQEAAQALVAAAFAAGARDDVTAVVVDTVQSDSGLSQHDTVTLERPPTSAASEITEPRR